MWFFKSKDHAEYNSALKRGRRKSGEKVLICIWQKQQTEVRTNSAGTEPPMPGFWRVYEGEVQYGENIWRKGLI